GIGSAPPHSAPASCSSPRRSPAVRASTKPGAAERRRGSPPWVGCSRPSTDDCPKDTPDLQGARTLERRNRKPSGNRSGVRLRAWTTAFVGTPYKAARFASDRQG